MRNLTVCTRSMKKWYKENGLKFGDRILTYVSRWGLGWYDGVGGFDLAPRREVGTVTFKANQDSAKLITSLQFSLVKKLILANIGRLDCHSFKKYI